MGASIIGGLFESVLGCFLKPLRRFFPSVVTGTVVLSIGLSLIGVGVNSFGGGSSAQDFGSMENMLLAIFVLIVILAVKHGTKGLRFLLDSGRNYCRLCCSIHHGSGASAHGHCSGRNRIYQSMGIKLG